MRDKNDHKRASNAGSKKAVPSTGGYNNDVKKEKENVQLVANIGNNPGVSSSNLEQSSSPMLAMAAASLASNTSAMTVSQYQIQAAAHAADYANWHSYSSYNDY